ncbi:type II toxin-antitoxin system RelE/ParE family toxin [Candidatus Bathyarchaeota archaeon]|nr:type II toxin-antitoxin system RelE/ParE family toxin [Candidatus Bathyarchaeota archaeon]MBL7080650.1 type II toxin-antitoxin system RelE/ParE family toxin [Candidatus Bathyarchaeota archaeon]
MAFEAALTHRFLRELRRLEADIRERALDAINEIIVDPFKGVKLRGELAGLHRWRLGSHRIVYMIDVSTSRIVFLKIGSRKAIYK